ncbi:hypothetical protein B0T11DRAFT_49952 [Plectosphaerella cucumerina]|uniref:Uncharacterized protein n=1 Tax=Plectosphaerella cucumerina TaxID=40658 RepID=A0A8K0X6M7_9PEZI|nr:hypothetical protein B0T11DRAFT_49952 [Plectosphaerella cucumerina]
MPRNVRPKSAVSRKISKRRNSDTSTSSSSLDLSDDGGYSAVEDITDSEDDDEEDVDAAEEEHIITRGATVDTPLGTPRPEPEVADEETYVADDDDDDDDDDSDDDLDLEPAEADVDDDGSWDGIVSEVDENISSDNHATSHRVSHERHVRFANVPSSDSDSTETEDDHADFFPDLFVDQNTLDPSFRREIENDDDDTSSTASGTFWDFHGVYEYTPSNDAEVRAIIQELEDDSTPVGTPFPLQEPAELVPAAVEDHIESEVQELDGYETDGETTEDDDDMPAPPIRRKTRRPSTVQHSDDSDAEPVKVLRGQPRRGRFNLDSSDRKPIAVVNPITRKMMIFTPHRRRHLDLSPEQFNMPQFNMQSSPMVGSSAHIMMSAMYSTSADFGDFLTTQTMGPAEAFFPFPSEADESSDIPDGDEDDAERSLDIDDFLTFDGPVEEDDDIDAWCRSDAIQSTPARPVTASSDVEMLSHINASNVGAFRRDQINQRLILSEKATQDSLAFSSPYNYTALRGIKSDRFETAAVPLTPMRRQKRNVQEFTRSPLETASAKRKASSEHTNGHKRHRSISDVNQLHL